MADMTFYRSEKSGKYPGRSGGSGTAEQSGKGDNPLPAIIMGLAFGMGGAIVMLLLISLAAVFYDIPDNIMNIMIIIISAAALFISGYKAAVRNEKNGLITGVITGLVFALVICAVGAAVFKTISFSPELIADLAIGAALGGLGGVTGINRVTAKKRKRKK